MPQDTLTVVLVHHQDDAAAAFAFAEELRNHGISEVGTPRIEVWVRGWEIDFGDDIVAKIDDGLTRALGGLILLSRRALAGLDQAQSNALIAHAVQRKDEGAFVMPVLLDADAEVPRLLAARMSAQSDDIDGIARAIRKHAARAAGTAALRHPSPTTPRRDDTPSRPGSGAASTVEIHADVAEWRIRTTAESDSEPRERVLASPLQNPLFTDALTTFTPSCPTSASGSDQQRVLGVAQSLGVQLAEILGLTARSSGLFAAVGTASRQPPRVVIVASGPCANDVLSLPWELLVLDDGGFAVEVGRLDVVRTLDPRLSDRSELHHEGPLSVVASLPVPENPVPEDHRLRAHEVETYKLQCTLERLGSAALVCDDGRLEELVEVVGEDPPVVLHLQAHVEDGLLYFEDEDGGDSPISVKDFVSRLRHGLTKNLDRNDPPRVFLLLASLPDGGACQLAAVLREAAVLHQDAFPAVVVYPGVDAPSTPFARAFYGALMEGRSLLQSVRLARSAMSTPEHPFAWSRIAVYLRGEDGALTTKGTPARKIPLYPRRIEETPEGFPVLVRGYVQRRGYQREIYRKLLRPDGGSAVSPLVIQGSEGIGKTALVSHILVQKIARDSKDRLVIRLGQTVANWTELRSVVEEHGYRIGIDGWEDEVQRLRQRTDNAVKGFELIVAALARRRPRLVIYVDNLDALQHHDPIHRSGTSPGAWKEGALEWWTALLRLSKSQAVICSGRFDPPGLSSDNILRLGPMADSEILRSIEATDELRKLPLDARHDIMRRVDGHPSTLQYLESLLAGTHPESSGSEHFSRLVRSKDPLTKDIVLPAFWKSLPDSVRRHAGALTVLSRPVHLDVIEAMGGTPKALMDAGIMVQISGDAGVAAPRGRWTLLSCVREYVSAMFDEEDRRAAQRAAVDAYSSLFLEPRLSSDDVPHLSPEDFREALDLCIACQDGKRATLWLDRFWRVLREQAQYRDGLEWLAKIKLLPPAGGEFQARALVLEHEILRFSGQQVDKKTSHVSLYRAHDLAATDELKARILKEMGRVCLALDELVGAERALSACSAFYSRELKGQQRRYQEAEIIDYLSTLDGLAQARSRRKSHHDARRLFEAAKCLAQLHFGKDDYHYVWILNNMLASCVEAFPRPDLQSYQAELSQCMSVLGEKHPLYPTVLDTLARVSFHVGDKRRAADEMGLAIQASEGLRGATELLRMLIFRVKSLLDVLESDPRRKDVKLEIDILLNDCFRRQHAEVKLELHGLSAELYRIIGEKKLQLQFRRTMREEAMRIFESAGGATGGLTEAAVVYLKCNAAYVRLFTEVACRCDPAQMEAGRQEEALELTDDSLLRLRELDPEGSLVELRAFLRFLRSNALLAMLNMLVNEQKFTAAFDMIGKRWSEVSDEDLTELERLKTVCEAHIPYARLVKFRWWATDLFAQKYKDIRKKLKERKPSGPEDGESGKDTLWRSLISDIVVGLKQPALFPAKRPSAPSSKTKIQVPKYKDPSCM